MDRDQCRARRAKSSSCQVEQAKGFNGLNAMTGEITDLVKAGIIDPAKVTRSALQNAASVAGLLFTTEAGRRRQAREEERRCCRSRRRKGRDGRHGRNGHDVMTWRGGRQVIPRPPGLYPDHPRRGQTCGRSRSRASRSSGCASAARPSRRGSADGSSRRLLGGERGPVGCAGRDVRRGRRNSRDPHSTLQSTATASKRGQLSRRETRPWREPV